ncbi:MAG: pyrroline-5-carboxylate reductase [Clostridiales bacterium]|nr:pyrroline-5-carboxylate reductase [Clostridiales bacterium]
MKKRYKLGIIGCGFMATTILRGAIESDFLRGKKIIVSDISEEQLDKVDYLGVISTNSNLYVAQNSEFVVLAVKSVDLPTVINSIKKAFPDKIISVIPDIKKSEIKNSLGIGLIRVARCVPNYPCTIGEGAIGIDMSDFNRLPDDTEFISNLFNNLGTVISVDEGKLDAVSAIGACGPTYAFSFLDSLISAGVKSGLTKSEAQTLAAQTLYGCAEIALNGDNKVEELLIKSCPAGSKNLQVIKTLEEKKFREIICEAVDACTVKTDDK